MQLFSTSRRTRVYSKIISAILVLLLNFAPVSPVFALPPQPSLKNPDIFSDTAQPKIDGSTGAFTQSIPLDIPPGRNGLQPDITLDYNSQRTQDSVVGYGWQLSIPSIQRLNKTGSQNLYGNTPYFTSSFDGELANISTTTSTTTSSSLTNNLAGYWKLDESSGNASDATSNGFTLTNNNSVSFSTGKINNGAVFASASNKNFSRSSASGLVPSSTLTVSAWVYLASNNGETIVSKGNLGTYGGPYAFAINVTNGLSFYSSNGSSAGWAGVNWTPSLNTWYHVAVTFNAGSVTFYVNGVQQGTTQSAVVSSLNQSDTNSFFAGAYSTSGGTTANAAFFDGKMDEVGIWYRVLSGSEISPLYNSGSGLSYPLSVATSSTAMTSQFLARIDNGSSRQYTYSTSTNTWTMYDKTGTRYLFGASDNSRQYDTGTGTSTNTYKWYLQEIRDPNNNDIKYTYSKDNNEVYPSQIIYTGNGVADGPATITFATSTRPDPRISFAPGFKVTTNYRLSEIDASFNGQLVRKYLLGYGTGNNGVRSLLISLQEQGYDDSNNLTTLPAMTFSYLNALPATTSSPFLTQNGVSESSYVVADANGDGVNDISLMYSSNGTNPTGGSINSTQLGGSTPDYWAGTGTSTYNQYPPWERGVRFLDVNADGKADVVRGYFNIATGSQATSLLLNAYSTTTNTYSWVSANTSIATLPNTLDAYWKFDESSGNAADSAGGNTLTNNNAATYVNGEINNAVKVVRSSSQYLNRASALGTTVGGPVTISTWINLASLPSLGQFYTIAQVGSGTQSPYIYYILNYENNGGTLQLNFNRSQACVQNNPQRYSVAFTTGTWHHIVMTYDGTNVTGYVDGLQVSQQAESGNGTNCSPDGWSAFGSGYSGGPLNGFDGTIDETGVWGRALSAGEVTQLYIDPAQ
jgi:hypothetical protein